ADSAAEETVPDILSPAEDTALDAPSPADTAGARAFDNSQAALLGRSLRPVRVARDRRRAGFALPMTPPVFWLPPSRIRPSCPQIEGLLIMLEGFFTGSHWSSFLELWRSCELVGGPCSTQPIAQRCCQAAR